MKSIYILRSVSGAGKSTLANQIALLTLGNPKLTVEICCADDFMVNENGKYDFKPEKLGFAHNKCKERFLAAIDNNVNLIIINNTSTKFADYKDYIAMGEKSGYVVFVMVLENYHNNKDIHNVPEFSLKNQENNIKNSLKLR